MDRLRRFVDGRGATLVEYADHLSLLSCPRSALRRLDSSRGATTQRQRRHRRPAPVRHRHQPEQLGPCRRPPRRPSRCRPPPPQRRRPPRPHDDDHDHGHHHDHGSADDHDAAAQPPPHLRALRTSRRTTAALPRGGVKIVRSGHGSGRPRCIGLHPPGRRPGQRHHQELHHRLDRSVLGDLEPPGLYYGPVTATAPASRRRRPGTASSSRRRSAPSDRVRPSPTGANRDLWSPRTRFNPAVRVAGVPDFRDRLPSTTTSLSRRTCGGTGCLPGSKAEGRASSATPAPYGLRGRPLPASSWATAARRATGGASRS